MNVGIYKKVTAELAALEEKPCCIRAFLSGAIRGAGELIFTVNGFALEFRHTDEGFVNKLSKLITVLCEEQFDVETTEIDMGDYRGKDRYFVLRLPSESAAALLSECNIVKNKCELVASVPRELIGKKCCQRAYLRGLFLSCGHLNLPMTGDLSDAKKTKGGYSVTFNLNSDMVIDRVRRLLAKCADIDEGKVHLREGANVLYIKTADAVSATLAALGSQTGVLAIEGIMAERQLKNDLNRKMNFDIANIDKQLSAGMKQCRDIKLIEDEIGLAAIPEPLREVCIIRLENPEANLEELGRMCNPPLSKSCINHRLRKIAQIADEYKK